MAKLEKKFRKLNLQVQSSSYTQILSALTDIRNILRTHKPSRIVPILQQTGLLKMLIKFLKKKYKKVLNMSLSIIGTSCLEPSARTMYYEETNLIEILLKLHLVCGDNDQTLSRIYRCISNFAEIRDAASFFFRTNPDIIDLIKTKALDDGSNASETTKQMAIRALRVLSKSDEHKKILAGKNIYAAIANHLNSTDKETLKAVLKAISANCKYSLAALDIQKACDGKAYEKLVKLYDDEEQRPLALQCLVNLAKVEVEDVRANLGSAGGIDTLFKEINQSSDKADLRATIGAVCACCSETVNRVRMRYNNQLPILLKFCTKEEPEDIQDMIMDAMKSFIFDEQSLRTLVQHGLMITLADKLMRRNRILSDITKVTRGDGSIGQYVHHSEACDKASYLVYNIITKEPDIILTTDSPYEKFLKVFRNVNEVTTETDSLPHETAVWTKKTHRYNDQEIDLYLISPKLPTEKESSVKCTSNVLMVLNSLIHYDWTLQYVTPTLMTALLTYLMIGGEQINKVFKVLAIISGHYKSFNTLVLQRFAIVVYTVLYIQEPGDNILICSVCKNKAEHGRELLQVMQKNTESCIGEGEMSYILKRGTDAEKVSAVLSIPLLVKKVSLLKKLLIGHNGLPLLLSLVSIPEEQYFAVLAISELGVNLNRHMKFFRKIDDEDDYEKPYFTNDKEKSEKKIENIVKFRLDDGSIVSADKDKLAAASDVFKSMLFGSFRESSQDTVNLSNISNGTFKLLLLYSDSDVESDKITFEKTPDINNMMDLIIAADKYLITPVQGSLVNYAKSLYFNSKDCLDLYRICCEKLNTCPDINELYEDTCYYILIGQIDSIERGKLFHKMCELNLWDSYRNYLYDFFNHTFENPPKDLPSPPYGHPDHCSYNHGGTFY